MGRKNKRQISHLRLYPRRHLSHRPRHLSLNRFLRLLTVTDRPLYVMRQVKRDLILTQRFPTKMKYRFPRRLSLRHLR